MLDYARKLIGPLVRKIRATEACKNAITLLKNKIKAKDHWQAAWKRALNKVKLIVILTKIDRETRSNNNNINTREKTNNGTALSKSAKHRRSLPKPKHTRKTTKRSLLIAAAAGPALMTLIRRLEEPEKDITTSQKEQVAHTKEEIEKATTPEEEARNTPPHQKKRKK